MTQPATARLLPDGRRLHLHHGPIDLILDAEGPGREAALHRAERCFQGLLQGLVEELPLLRAETVETRKPKGVIAKTMWQATAMHAGGFVTPMAAVAGAVADYVLAEMRAGAAPLTKAYVNNGGDIAFHLAPGETLTAAVAGGLVEHVRVTSDSRVRGIATSGWRGRSHSLGIADAVTVLAETAAAADVAATLIANAVDLPGHSGIARVPACDLAPDSDLGARLVTCAVGTLTEAESARALRRGERVANEMRARGVIEAAALMLNDLTRVVGRLPLTAPRRETSDA